LLAIPAIASSLTLLTTHAVYGDPPRHGATTTPIEHLIVIVGENHTFDNVYGTYQP